MIFSFNKRNNVRLLLNSLLFLTFCSVAQAGAGDCFLSPADESACRDRIDAYCRAWMEDRYEVMHAMLSPHGMGRMEKDRFVDLRQKLAKQGRKPIRYQIGEASITAPENPTMDVMMEFSKAVAPGNLSGKHKFHMVKTNGQWLIRYITPPLSPRGNPQPAGGSGPGM